MSFQINTDSSLAGKLLEAAESYKSKVINTEVSDFADYLKENFTTIDKDGNNELSKDEILKSVEEGQKNPELQKIIENKNIESIIADIDLNGDSKITYKEVDPSSKLSSAMSSAFKDFTHSKDLGFAARNLANKIGQSFYLNNSAQNMLASAVDYIL